MTLDHVAGPDGGRLVPDLALALPRPDDGGRTYRFTLRSGIRYSDGAPLRPGDVTHSFERLFAIGSAGAPLYTAIRGATACIRTPSRCDLSQGIVADDRTGTVTFHLTRPDPDFLYKLTVSFAYVVPAATPERQARTPLPATGPYMITRYVAGRELRLVRNPYFHEWSAAAQPSGYPDRIAIPLALSPARADTAIASGQVDFYPNLGRLPGRDARDLLVNRRIRVHIHPALVTGFMFLNTNAPPFNQIGVRRALNLAYDRGAAVDGWGGTLAAQPACQLLPPGAPGIPPTLPLHQPSPRRRTLEGNRSRAGHAARRRFGHPGYARRRLERHPIALGGIAETRVAVATLRKLGYRASLRLLPESTYFTSTGDSRNRAQVVGRRLECRLRVRQ